MTSESQLNNFFFQRSQLPQHSVKRKFYLNLQYFNVIYVLLTQETPQPPPPPQKKRRKKEEEVSSFWVQHNLQK